MALTFPVYEAAPHELPSDEFNSVDFQRLLEWSGPEPEVVNQCIHELFAQQAVACPEAIAVEAWDGFLTYAELDALSNTLALQLIDRGVGPEAIVPFCSFKSKWVPVCLLGILRAGAACAALDPELPRNRLAEIVTQSGAKTIVASPECSSSVVGLVENVQFVDESLRHASQNCRASLGTRCQPQNAAVVQFTSGSTGTPKGILLEHTALCSSFAAFSREWRISRSSRVFQFSAHTFDVAIADILGTLTCGGCVCIPSEDERRNDLEGVINRMRVNWALFTPSLAKVVRPEYVPTLQTLVVGGEAVMRENLSTWANHCDLILAYGLAEASIYCMGTMPVSADGDPSCIGRPIGCRVWICNEDLEPVSFGEIGELLLDGPILARNYLGDPAKTARTFIPTPTWLQPYSSSSRVLRTGDLVRYCATGTLQYLGRGDDQVKLRGIRIELGDIEHHLKVDFGQQVNDIAVELIEPNSDKSKPLLIAVIVPATQNARPNGFLLPLTKSTKRHVESALVHAQKCLPSYMLPTVFLPISQMPMTPSKKRDRRALRGLLQDVSSDLLRHYTFEIGPVDEVEDLSDTTEFWRSYLKGASPIPFPVPLASPTGRRELQQVEHVAHDLLLGTSELAHRALLTAAWALLIGRHSESNDIVFGSGSSRHKLVPLRKQICYQQNLSEFVKSTQRDLREIDSLPSASIEQIKLLGPDTLASCNLNNAILLQDDQSIADHGLLLVVRVHVDGQINSHTFSAEFDASVLTSAFLKHFLAQFEHVLRQLIQFCNGPTSLNVIDFFSPLDREFVSKLNSRNFETLNSCVHEEVAARCAEHPDRIAIHACDAQLSYAELDHFANRLALHLITLGVSPETYVAFCLDKGAFGIVVEVGIMKAGAAFVALSAEYPQARLEEILSDASVRVVLTNARCKHRFANITQTVVVLDDEYWAEQSRATVADVVLPNTTTTSACALVYTSGSSGKPKGVILEHEALCTSVRALGKALSIDNNSKILQFAAWTFGASIGEIYATFFYGGCVCIPAERDCMEDLASAINRFNCNWAWLTSSVISLISPSQVPTLKTLCLGGEAARQDDVRKWANDVHLIVTYGQTEGTVRCACFAGLKTETPATTIGQGYVANLWIIEPDNDERLAPVGAVGEIAVEGPIVARGYLNLVDGNVFIEDPRWLGQMDTMQKRRVLKTGDLAKYDANGNLVLVGRRDGQRKLHGIRIEVGEIENQLNRLGYLRRAVVDIVKYGPDQRQILVAFVVAEEHNLLCDIQLMHSGLTDSLRRNLLADQSTLLEQLPEYMLPSHYIPLRKLPTTTTGKCDRKSLISLVETMTATELVECLLSASSTKHRITANEKLLAHLWASVLSVDETIIGRDSSFFALGGKSIQAMRLVALARSHGMHLAVALIFEQRTLSAIALHMKVIYSVSEDLDHLNLKGNDLPAPLVKEVAASCRLNDDAVEDVYPCTPMQAALLSSSAKTADAYCRHIGFTLPDGITLSVFRQAWDQVALLNPILRTRIVESSTGLVQAVVKDEIQWKDYESIEQAVEDGRFRTTKRGAALLCFAALPDQTAILSIHHAIFDGWSLGSLIHDVTEVLRGNSPQPRGSFRQFVEYCCGSIKVDEAMSYWADRLVEGNTARFPEVPMEHTVQVDATTEKSIEIKGRSPQACNASLATLAQATWAILSKAYSDMDNVTFGLTVSGRNAAVPRIESISGPTVTTVPMQLSLRPGTTITALVDMIQDQVISMIPYEQLGLDLIGKASDEALQAVDFQTLFVVQPDSSIRSSPQSVGITVQNHNRPAITTYPLTLECRSTSTGFNVIAYFDSFVICREQMARLLNQFEHTLLTLCTVPGSSVLSELTLFTKEDAAEISEWNSELAEPNDTCIHELISSRAKQQPHSIALHASDGEISYEGLDQLSSRICSELIRRGVRGGAKLPFVFEKSLWATVAVLAILKAGGVCVPIETSNPDARKKSIVKKMGAFLVLASTSVDMTWCEDVSILTIGWTEMPALTKLNSDQPKITIQPQDMAYMLFTSGSTSEPKGVIWNHRTVSTTLLCLGRYWNFHEGIRVLQYAAHVFDISVFEMLGTLAFGGCVCIPSDQERAERLTNFISCKAVDWAALTPTVLRTMDPRSVPKLRTLVSIGEPIGRRIIDVWAGKLNLFNGYGPCEACIFTTLASVTLDARYPESIGLPVGCAVWIVEREEVNRLVPIGFTGEIVVEGYNVGAGYFPPNSKTANAFIPAPRWAQTRSNSTSAWYRTGDIGRYNSDGSISLLGRNDDQVKVRGQRFRISEVEKIINKHDDVGHIIVTIPKTGASSGRLTAVLTLSSLDIDAARTLEPLPQKDQVAGGEILEKITVHASAELPLHMLPNVWLLVQAMPKNSSGKLDRFQIKQWLSNYDSRAFPKADLSAEQPSRASDQIQSADERVLQTIWSAVLNLPLQQIGRDSSFIKLGGDSISAMQVASKCRARNLPLSIGDVIQCGTLARLAQRVADARVSNHKTAWQNPLAVQEDKHDYKVLRAATDEMPDDNPTECGLSPIQALLMKDGGPASHNHFNQSCTFELTQKVSLSSLQKALATLSSCHAMLTARFRQDHRGKWIQCASSDGTESVRLTSHKVNNLVEAQNIVSAAQASLDIVSGPVFAVELIQVKTGHFKYGLLFATAHHLVVDLVSWRIILEDLAGLLEGSKAALSKSMSFIDWVKKQEKFGTKVLLPVQVPNPPQSDLDFWGMKGEKSLRRDIVTQTFSLCHHSSSALLMEKCHKAYGTTTLDLLLAATLGSFVKAFPDRGVPALYNESFGREPWDASIDPSRTVGWFTTLYPVIPNIDATSHLPHVVRATKDSRLEHSRNGWRIFTASMLSQTPLQRSNFEILFNYSGYVKQAEDRSGILRHLPPGTISAEDIAPDAEMFGLINISVRVVEEKLRFSLMYNKNMAHTDRLGLWARDLQTTLLALTVLLEKRSSQLTLADLPLLRIGYNDLDFLHRRLRDACLNPENIESIYSCSPVQEGILLAQIQQPDKYWTLGSFKITSLSEFNDLSADGLAKAWELVCENHSILRTVFVNDLLRDRAFHQVVLRKVVPSVSFHAFSNAADIGYQLRSLPLQQYGPNEPQHHLSICYVGDQFYFRMEGNHALHDAAGIQLMCEELAHAFDTGMSSRCISNYAPYISWIEQQRKPALRWWKKHMFGTLPCYFPKLTNEKPKDESQCITSTMGKVKVKYANEADILAFCQSHGITISTLFQAAWAIVLRGYTGDKSVNFGYLASGRDAPVENIDNLLGPTINLLVCRLDIQPNDSMIDFLYRAQDTFAQCVSHQAFSLTELQHILSVRGKPLFNTAMSLQRIWATDLGGHADTKIELVDFHDPSEYDVVLAVTYSSESVQTVIKFKESHLSPFFANTLAETISRVVTKIARHPDAAPDSFDVVDIDTREKLVELNCNDEALQDVENDDGTTKAWQAPVSDVECELHRTWCEALRVAPERIGIFDTFKRVGGDSLTAIQIVARCRQKGLKLSVQLIFHCNGIADLAGKIEKLDATRAVDIVDAPFELSPIQKTVVEGKAAPENHHAMSFLLKIHRCLQLEELQIALKLVIERHPMLRARFVKPAHKWMQVLSADVNGSFTSRHHRDKKLEDLEAVFRTTQIGINLHSGPIGAAILCDVNEGQYLFLTIHHLIVDPVSCQILIRDLSQALTDGFLPPQTSLSFRSWVARQAELAKALRIEDCLPYQVPYSDYDYWGMSGLPNRAGDAVIQEFKLSKEATQAVVKDSVGFLDTLIATSLCAFSYCFPDRTTLPAVFTDNHGRETWEEGEDLLETVGWFSSVFPIALQPHVNLNDVMEVVQHVKALRRSLPRNGSDYFTSRWLSTEGQEAFARHFPIEIMCHYYGSAYRELEGPDTLFSRVSRDIVPLHPASDDFEVLALLSVAAEVQDEQLRVFVGYSKDIRRQPQIREWIGELERLLHGIYYAS